MSSLSPARRVFASALALLMLLAASSGAICQTICASRASMPAATASPHAHCREMPAGPAIAAPPSCVPIDGVASSATIVSTIVRSELVMAAAPLWRPGGTTTAPNGASARRMRSPISPPRIGDPPSVLRI
jgi:hypothetical protein